MGGVIVHAEHVYREVSLIGAAAVLIIASAIILALCCAVVTDFKKKASGRWRDLCILVFITILGVFGGVLAVCGANEIHKDLIVTIDDSVGFNEFNDRYKIMSQDGNLYTVRELPIEETEPEEAGDNE